MKHAIPAREEIDDRPSFRDTSHRFPDDDLLREYQFEVHLRPTGKLATWILPKESREKTYTMDQAKTLIRDGKVTKKGLLSPATW